MSIRRNRFARKILSGIGSSLSENKYIIEYTIRLLENNYYSDFDDFYKFLLLMINVEDHQLLNQKIRKILGKGEKEKKQIQDIPDENLSHWLGKNSYEIPQSSFNLIFLEMKNILLKQLKELKKQTNDMEKRFENIGRVFKLDQKDLEILKFAYFIIEDSNRIGMILPRERKLIDSISVATQISEKELIMKLGKNSQLIKTGIIEPQANFGDRMAIDDSIAAYLSGFNEEKDLLSEFFSIDHKETLDFNQFEISVSEKKMLLEILKKKNPCHILFHGSPGTGKTEFARSLAKNLGCRAIFVKNRAEKNRQVQLAAALNFADKNDLIIVDEADQMLNTRYFLNSSLDKGWLNSVLDNIENKVLWITNETDNMEDSVLRRFDYSVQFKPFTDRQRIAVWKNVLRGKVMQNVLSQRDIVRLASEYPVNAAGIAIAVSTVCAIMDVRNTSKKEILKSLVEILEKHDSLIHGGKTRKPEKKSPMKKILKEYDVSSIHMDQDSEIILESLRACSKKIKSLRNKDIENCNLLFWGLPGTGKTEFAKYLAEKLKMRIHLKRYSDLESPYVGMTEKNIAAAFRAAENEKAILFIDEADSFFTDRQTAGQSWEISRTNELLTQMENFNGIFVCCTNLRKNMDSAAMRRFSFKVEFRPLKKENRVNVYSRYFQFSHEALTDSQKKKIESLDGICFGDFAAVANAQKYLKKETLSHEKILLELEKELFLKNPKKDKPIGFYVA